MSLKSQKMATLSVNAMEMARHPYDTIDKASVQNFYDEIRPKVLPATSTEQLSRVPIIGGELVMVGVVWWEWCGEMVGVVWWEW